MNNLIELKKIQNAYKREIYQIEKTREGILNADPDDILFCGMSIGYRDEKDPVNSLRSERTPLKDWSKFL